MTAGAGSIAGMMVAPPTGGGQGGLGGIAPPTGGASAGTMPPEAGTSAGTGPAVPVGNGSVFDGGSDPARNMVQAGSVCARLAAIQCAGEAFCCTDAGRDRAACEAAQSTSCASKGYVDHISRDPASGFDAAHAATVFTELERLASTCDPSIGTFAATTQGLVGIFKGTRAPGADCGPGGGILNPPSKEEAAVALTSCNTIDSNACMPTSSAPLDPWKCAGKAGAGAQCLTDLNCQAGNYCANPALAGGSFGLGTCGARKAPASPCAAGNECTSLYCVSGSCGDVETQAAYCLAKQQ